MFLQILKAKIQGLVVNESNINYPGSISLPEELMVATGIREFELVHVNNRTNGNRILTYAIRNKKKGMVTINGAASKLFNQGDIIHVLAFAFIDENEANTFKPVLVITNNDNILVEKKPYCLE